ncbi:MAG: DUF1015 domain-containing protein [Candidatus Dormibacteraeota bacterium]|uniref:DUF1015 domain-containing protein n=1 Tax=Candidatus Aeolococcus gillhamiae TaxID=3127015 RepID=A0A934K2T1_9BACT|nr:DUF1015 domain-containing protein [Candidatus Dormibacteraeota bacterium]
MADVRPLRGIHFNPDLVHLGGVLAPPYDVIDDAQREELYGRDLRNIVRIDFGRQLPGDEPGVSDRYTRAAEHLAAWLSIGVLVRDPEPSFYVTEHRFPAPDGSDRVRRGLIARVRATAWEDSDLRPHEHTLRGPKEDRLALMRATSTQTSPVFAVWQGAAEMDALLAGAAGGRGLLGGRIDGEIGSEKHLLWVVNDPPQVHAIEEALRGARLYIADGHHRYETAAAYAAERAAAGDEPDADSQFALVYLADANDPGISLLPTHRLLLSRAGAAFSLDDLWMRLDDGWDVAPSDDLAAAGAAAAAQRDGHHAFAVRARDGAAVLSRPRSSGRGACAALDVVVLQDQVLGPAGADGAAIREGALAYTRSLPEVDRAVAAGEAVLGFGVNPATTAEMIAVADAGEVMPQKSTYFYPKVPTGLVLSPL